jgi:hypothetical protein
MQVAILESSLVINLVQAASVEAASVKGFTAVDGTNATIGDRWTGSAFVSPPPPPKTWETPLEFMKEFTLSEEAAIRTAARTDVLLETLLARLAAAHSVQADTPLTIQGMDYLVAQGLISASRKTEILGA